MQRIKPTPNTHIYLYAKKWYQKTDIINDLKILVAERSGCLPEHVTEKDILVVLISIVGIHIQQGNFDYKFLDFISDLSPDSTWKYTEEQEYNFNRVLIGKCLSVLSMVDINDIPGRLGEPDPKILPVSENAKKFFKC